MNLNEEIEKLKKDFTVSQAVAKNNLKWGGIAVAIILSFLGYNSFITLPEDAQNAAKKAVKERIDKEISERLGDEIVLKIKNLNNEIVGLKSEAEKLTEDMKKILKDVENDKLFSELNSLQSKIESLSSDIKKYGVLSVDWAYGSKSNQRIKGKEKGKEIKLQCKEPSAKNFHDNYLYIKRP